MTIINPTEYLSLIGLADGGIKPDRMRQTEFLATMEKYTSKIYIHIFDFYGRAQQRCQ